MTMTMVLMALQTAAGSAGIAPPAPPSGVAAAHPAGTVPPMAAAPLGVPSAIGTAAPARTRADRARVLAAVDAEWRRYDVHGAGRLGPLEFATWVMRANGAMVAPGGVRTAPGIRPISALNATARAFARADANHDGGVTPAEMTDFLMR